MKTISFFCCVFCCNACDKCNDNNKSSDINCFHGAHGDTSDLLYHSAEKRIADFARKSEILLDYAILIMYGVNYECHDENRISSSKGNRQRSVDGSRLHCFLINKLNLFSLCFNLRCRRACISIQRHIVNTLPSYHNQHVGINTSIPD